MIKMGAVTKILRKRKRNLKAVDDTDRVGEKELKKRVESEGN